MRDGCAILGLVIYYCSIRVLGLQCHYCGWSSDVKEYQILEEGEKDPPYPVARRHMARNLVDTVELSSPPNKAQVEKYCEKQTCKNGKNSACAIWSFKSTHPINITFMCVGNPKKLSGCYQQKVPDQDYMKIEVCLCADKNFCNDATRHMNFQVLTLVLAALLVLLL